MRQATEEEANFKVGTPKYSTEWQVWLDGNIWALTPGEDFQESVEAFRAHCYYMARQYRITIRTKFAKGLLYIQSSAAVVGAPPGPLPRLALPRPTSCPHGYSTGEPCGVCAPATPKPDPPERA